MPQMLAIAQAVVADAIRRKVTWVVLVFAALLAFAVPSLPSYGQGVVDAVYREVTIALMYAAAMVVAVALAATRVPAEIERRTVFTILARDVRRWQYLVGSWLGMFIVTGFVLLAFTLVAIATGAFVYSKLMPVLFLGALSVWFETGVVVALALLVSTRFGAITAVVAALAFLFIGHSLPGLLAPLVGQAWWLPSLEVFNVINPVAHGDGFGAAYAGSMTVVFVAWIAALLSAASLLFASRDL
jgi:ABC-type transport system involved in multi-copper enzyme maturation permease subunit